MHDKFNYDPHTGILSHAKGARKGQPIGTKNSNKLLVVSVNGSLENVHRVIWEMTYGDPDVSAPYGITHIDGDRMNNRIDNLGARTLEEKMQAGRNWVRRDGVGIAENLTGGFTASISIDGTQKTIGVFDTFEDAVIARKSAERHVGLDPHEGKDLPPFEELRQRREDHLRHVPSAHRIYDLPKGVSPNNKAFVARIHIDGKLCYLGSFASVNGASAAYQNALTAKIAGHPLL